MVFFCTGRIFFFRSIIIYPFFFFFQCGLPSLEECKELAENAHAEGEIFQAVKNYLLSPEPEKALPIGITYVKGEFLRLRLCLKVVLFTYINICKYIQHRPTAYFHFVRQMFKDRLNDLMQKKMTISNDARFCQSMGTCDDKYLLFRINFCFSLIFDYIFL